MARVGNTCGDPSAANMGSGYSSIPPPSLHYLCTDTIQVLLQSMYNAHWSVHSHSKFSNWCNAMIQLYDVHPLCTDTMQEVLLHIGVTVLQLTTPIVIAILRAIVMQ